MKIKIIALLIMIAMLISMLPASIFAATTGVAGPASSGLQSSYLDPSNVNKSGSTEHAIVAGYTTGTGAETINIDGKLGVNEGWVLPGRLLDASAAAKGSFGAQWNKDFLYLAVERSSAQETITLILNGNTINISALSTNANLKNAIAELKIPMSMLGIGAITGYNAKVSIELSLSSGGSYKGSLKLSSVNWWNTSNVSNSIASNNISCDPMRGYDITDAVEAGTIGGENITNGLHLWDNYKSGYIGSMTEASYGGTKTSGLTDRDKTVYISFDFKADAMPEYELAEAMGAYHHSRKCSNFGFSWQIGDAYDSGNVSNVTMGGIVNTADGLYLIVAGKYYHTLKLNKQVGDTFNVALAWHSNGDVTVYIDGAEQGHYSDATRKMLSVINKGISLMCWRDELHSVTSEADNFDLYITNMAFGSALPETPVKVLDFKDIQGANTSAEDVTSDLVLPTTLNGDIFPGETITWESSNPAVISATGKVTRPAIGAEKVTLKAKDSVGNSKSIDVIVIGNAYTKYSILAVQDDINPGVGAATAYQGKVFHFDSNNNSIVYDQGKTAKVNVIKLTDLDEVSRLNRETISIWTSDNNSKYTRVEDDYKLLHVGKDWYLYNFEANARYIKVNYTLYEDADQDAAFEYIVYDSTESDFTNVLGNIMTVYYEDVFGANRGSFSKKTVTVTNNTGKKQQDYPWCISTSNLGLGDLSKIRVKLGNDYLFHYVSGNDLYVRIPDLENGETASLTVLYGNSSAMDTSDKESVYEVTYGTKEMYQDDNQRFLFTLEAGTVLRNGTTLEKDRIIDCEGYSFRLSDDGGVTWRGTDSIKNEITGYTPHASGGYIFDRGRLYWRTYAYEGNILIVYSDDGGKSWKLSQIMDKPTINGHYFEKLGSYANGIALSTADGVAGSKVDLIFPLGGEVRDGNSANVFLISRDAGNTWTFGDAFLFTYTEQRMEGGFTESTILENEAHEVVWYCRYQTNKSYHFATAVSKDGGLTWSEPKESTVYASCTQPIMAEIDGDPLFVWGGNNAFGGQAFNRGPLSVAVSYDGLYTFRNIQNVFTETFLEDYDQLKYFVNVTNPSVVKCNEDLIMTYYWVKKYKVFIRITDYENWFYRTKGIYDSFESQNTKYEGWVPYMGGTALSANASAGKYSLEVLPYGVVSRSVPYLQNGTVSMNVYSDGTSTYSIELQSAFSPVMNKSAPVSFTVKGNALYANGVNTGLTLKTGWNSLSINLGLAKKSPTASVSVNGSSMVSVKVNAAVGDYVCYIAVNTGAASICVDEVLVQSNLDAINYDGEIKEVDVKVNGQPTNQDKKSGEKATFRVTAQGNGLMYQWYVNSGNGWKEIVGATSATYTTDTLETANNGWQYKCVVTDRNENTVESTAATLKVVKVSNPTQPSNPTEPSNPTQPSNPTEPSNPTQPSNPTEPSNPTQPSNPTEPSNPTQPSNPTEPSNPTQPSNPTEPSNPTQPSDPTEPSNPTQPSDPTEPSNPTQPSDPTEPSNPTQPSDPTEPGETTESDTPTIPNEPGASSNDSNNSLVVVLVIAAVVVVLAGAAAAFFFIRRKRMQA